MKFIDNSVLAVIEVFDYLRVETGRFFYSDLHAEIEMLRVEAFSSKGRETMLQRSVYHRDQEIINLREGADLYLSGRDAIISNLKEEAEKLKSSARRCLELKRITKSEFRRIFKEEGIEL